ncbi:PsbP domain-containing protein [Drosera capensis]
MTAAAAAAPMAAIHSTPSPPRHPHYLCKSRPRNSLFISALLNANGGRGRGGRAPSYSASDDLCFNVTRREATLHMPLSLAAALLHLRIVSPVQALEEAPDGFRIYSDDANKYRIFIPQVSVLITGLGPDYTRLESFGKVDDFAETLVSGLDRSWQRPPGVAAKLIDTKSANGLYYIEYTLQKPGESRRHIYTAMGIGNNGWANRLFTVTGQFLEEESERYNSVIEKIILAILLVISGVFSPLKFMSDGYPVLQAELKHCFIPPA